MSLRREDDSRHRPLAKWGNRTQIFAMSDCSFSVLAYRGVIAVSGADRVEFLQGLISNDTSKVAPGHAVWAALLTPQGRFLNDMFVVADGETLLLETERERAAALDLQAALPGEGRGSQCDHGSRRRIRRRDRRGASVGGRTGGLRRSASVRARRARARPGRQGCSRALLSWLHRAVPRRLRCAAALSGRARRQPRPRRREGTAARERLRRVERRRLAEGLLHGPGAHRPHQVPRADPQATVPGTRRRRAPSSGAKGYPPSTLRTRREGVPRG